jgi:plasmid segregation protein ParM
MSDVLRLLAAEITKDIGTPYRDYDAIDLALRTGKAPVIFQKPYDMKRPAAAGRERGRAGRVDDEGVDRGAAQPAEHHPRGRWRLPVPKAVKAAFPKHRIHEVKEPMFANVRGFSWPGRTTRAA